MKIVQQLYIYNCMRKINYLHIKFVRRHYLYIIIMIHRIIYLIMKAFQQLYIYNCVVQNVLFTDKNFPSILFVNNEMVCTIIYIK